MVSAQSERIAEIEEALAGEVATAEVTHDEIQRTRARFIRLGEEIRDRASGVLADTTMLIEEMMEVVQNPAQEEDPKEDPEEDPEKEISPGSPTVDEIQSDKPF